MIVIVTDSTACLDSLEAQRLNVRLVSMTYTLDGVTRRESFADENGDYIACIDAAHAAATSQPAAADYAQAFRELTQSGHQVLCLAISSRLSGAFATQTMCAREFGDSVRVVDTLTTAGGLYLLVCAARELIDAGYSLEDTASAIERMRGGVQLRFSVGDMEPLRRSGRLGPVRQSVGTVLNVRPVLVCRDGAVASLSLVRGRSEQQRALISAVPESARCAVIHYIADPQTAKQLQHRLQARLDIPVLLKPVGPVLAAHLGTDLLGVAWME